MLEESCKTIIKNVNLARFWQKRQILQESDRKVISCKNLARFLKDLHHQENFLQDLHHYADKNSMQTSFYGRKHKSLKIDTKFKTTYF